MMRLINTLKEQNRLLLLAYGLVLVSFFLPNRVNSIALLIFGILSFLPAVRNRKNFLHKGSVVSFLLFFVLCLGITYSENKEEGLAIIERSLSLLIIPFLIIPFRLFNTAQKRLLLNGFILSAFLAGLYCIGFASYAFLETGTAYPTGQTGHFIYNRFMHHQLSSALGIHAIYFSFYCSFAAIAVLQKVLFANNNSRLTQVGNVFLILFFIGLIYLLKSSLFAFIFPLSCLLLVFIKFKNQLQQPKYSIAFILICIITAFFSYKGVRSKLDNFETTFNFEDQSIRPLAMRLAMWTSAWEVVQEQVFLGVGTGDAQDELMNEYKRVHFAIGEKNNFNAHNMYLQYWISNGILMLLLFVVFLTVLFIKAVQHRNFLFFAFTLFYSFFSLTESTMLKQKGIVFFVFFAFLFMTDPNCWKLPASNADENNTST
ncbi:MAG: O-antigen ligase family protein [Flavobacteriales bacterium]|nr:O-antigen ligase family protein [Flavobacteriales bacterium]